MADGSQILDDATALSFPRYPGTDGDAAAITWVEDGDLQGVTFTKGPPAGWGIWISYEVE